MTKTLDQVIEEHRVKFPAICDLYEWSQNFDYPSPMSYFLDLIGYSQEEFNDTLGDWPKVTEKIYLHELDLIARAVVEYANNPRYGYTAIKDLVDFGG